MKPLYLKMSAFGSYGKEEVIDFSKVNHGIFLITGDTGSGKTTIFDALTYALYDKTSGGRRDGEMMRSQYAGETTQTFVELEFLYNGEKYKIRRSPKQSRKSKRKNAAGEYAIITELPSVELTLPDGKEFHGKIRDTNKKIEEIIGLDVNQFTQIAMIAQGDFLKLLQASSKERKEIFQKIFDTKIYFLMEMELNNRFKEAGEKLKDNRKAIERELQGVRLLEESSFLKAWEEKKEFRELKSEELLELLKKIIGEVQEQEKKIQKELDEKTTQLEALGAKQTEGRATNLLFTQREANQKKLLCLREEEPQEREREAELQNGRKALHVTQREVMYQAKKKDRLSCEQELLQLQKWTQQEAENLSGQNEKMEQFLQACEKQLEEAQFSIRSLTEHLPEYQILDELRLEITKLGKGLEDRKQLAHSLEERLQKQKSKRQLLLERQEEQQKLLATEPKLQEQVRTLQEQSDGFQQICCSLMEYQQAEKIKKEKEQVYVESRRQHQEEEANYQKLFEEFLHGQASLLREHLTEGEPCPVCGSIHHVIVDQEAENTVTEEQLRTGEQRMKSAEKNYHKADREMQESEGTLTTKKELLNLHIKRIVLMDSSLDEQTLENLDVVEERQKACKKLLKQVQKGLADLELKRQEQQEEEQQAETLLKAIETDAASKEKNQGLLAKEQIQYEIQKTKEQEIVKKLIYGSEKEAQSKLNELKALCQEKMKDRDTRVQKLKERQTRLQERKGEQKQRQELFLQYEKEEKQYLEAYEAEAKNQGFQEMSDYQEAVRTEAELQKLQEQCEQYKKDVAICLERASMYESQLTGKQLVDMELLQQEYDAKKEEKEEINRRNKELYSLLQTDKDIYRNIKTGYAVRQEAEETYTMLKRLADTANGRLYGLHMNFQTFIQRKYFRRIIQEANKRLLVMSKNQFLLQCRDIERISGGGEAGLDLDVYSIALDSTRDVKTLSGGESFMASLAMALGMSDIIQQTAGRINIDTMFIDEGFGTLSEQARNESIGILRELSADKRLIGIISHVSELKAQIEPKLIVSKSGKGSQVTWEF